MNTARHSRRPEHGDRLEAAARAMGMTNVEPQDVRELRRPPLTRPNYNPMPRRLAQPTPLPPTWAPGPNSVGLLGLLGSSCRFPVGDDDGIGQLFCGEVREPHEPYCKTCLGRVDPKNPTPNPKVLN